MKKGVLIVVTAKGDFGYSPHFGQYIVKKQMNEETGAMVPVEYTIDEAEWNPNLFERPSPEWQSIPEREALATAEPPAGVEQSAEVAAVAKPDVPAADKNPKSQGSK